VASLARQFFSRSKSALDLGGINTSALEPREREQCRDELRQQQACLSSWRNPSTNQLVEAAAQAAVASTSREYTGPADPRLAELLRRALVQLVSLQLARLDGDHRDLLTDPFFSGACPNVRNSSAPEITLGECISRYHRECLDLKAVTAKTAQKQQSLLEQVSDFFGASVRISDVSRADCNRFRDILAKLPPNFGKIRGRRTLDELASTNRSRRTLSWETQNNYLRMLEALFRWAVRERLIRDNVSEGISPLAKRASAEEQRLPFSAEELKAIFNAPLYTGCEDDERRFRIKGCNIIRRSRYWVPLIALYSGMRMGEILQLTPNHVRKSRSGTDYFVLTRDMKLKTPGAEREVPVHKELIRLGFIDWVEARRGDADKPLFNEVRESKHGYRSDIFTKRFATFLRSIAIESDRRSKLCFHSFRHTFKDALNETGATEEIKDEICGWSRAKKTGRRYGSGLSADLLKPFIDRVSFDVSVNLVSQ
jgi:integrase